MNPELLELKLLTKELNIAILLLNKEIQLLRSCNESKETTKEKKRKRSEIEEDSDNQTVYLVTYKKCYALFGNTKPIKDELKKYDAIYNNRLKDPTKNNKVNPGWLIRKKHLNSILEKYPMIEDLHEKFSITDE